jgi:drug/metabolite transporter (DMT)-like permease
MAMAPTPPITAYDALGLVGAAMFVVAFAGVQIEKLDARGWPALALNFVGAILVLISLIHAFNLASFVLESVWGLVAAYGLLKLFLRR